MSPTATSRRSLTVAAVLSAGLLLGACAPGQATPTTTAGPTAAPAAPSGSATAGTWRDRAPMALERQELYPEVLNDRIYVAGGLLNPNTGASAHFDAYDPATDTWQQLAALPDTRHHIGLAAVGGRVYGVGGFTGGFPRWQAQADSYVYDPAANQWSPGPELPEPRAEFTIEAVGDRIHVIGGRVRETPAASSFTTHVDTTIHNVLDPATGTWTSAAAAPTARNSAASVVIGEEIFVVGGRQFPRGADSPAAQTGVSALEVYNTRTDTWRTVAPLPAPGRGGLAASVHDGAIYVFGGEQLAEPAQVFGDVWRYDPATDTWTQAGTLPTPRHGLGAGTVGDTVYTFGGSTRPGGNFASDRTEALDLG